MVKKNCGKNRLITFKKEGTVFLPLMLIIKNKSYSKHWWEILTMRGAAILKLYKIKGGIMRKKLWIGVIVLALILIGGYLTINSLKYNDIVKIEVNLEKKIVLTDKNDIKEFMKNLDTMEKLKEPIFRVVPEGVKIENNLIITSKDNSEKSLLMSFDYQRTEITISSGADSIEGYKINKESTEKIFKLLEK